MKSNKRRLFVLFFGILALFGFAAGSNLGRSEANGVVSIFLPFLVKGYVPPTTVSIAEIADNSISYPSAQVPKYEKLEITFQISNTAALNLQMPYDANPPAGVVPKIGITVNGEFSQNNFQTFYTIPGFYYEDFDNQTKSGKEWIYPTGNSSWKVRFAPNNEGVWQYRLTAQDASGSVTSQVCAFTVAPTADHGFVRASQRDPRYFEYDDGVYFAGLGYNMNFRQVSWLNPTLDNQENFQKMQANGIELARIWLSQWPIFSDISNPWNSLTQGQFKHVTTEYAYPGSESSMELIAAGSPTMFLGWESPPLSVKRNTNYRVSVRYFIPIDLTGPRVAGQPYGLVAKTANTWLSNPWDSGTGTLITPHAFSSPKDNGGTAQWATVEGNLDSGDRDYIPFLYLAMENVTDLAAEGGGTHVYIDKVEIAEALGNGQWGPNIVYKPWMAHHQYFSQDASYRFDKVMDLAHQNDVYFKVVGLEKNDYTLNHFDYEGNTLYDQSLHNDQYFYGNWRLMTKSRWLEQAWWRYLQARWGYSTNIHSWELLNEGDPFNGLHYTMADEFAKYMHQFAPNQHLVSTSVWHSDPVYQFWGNASFQNVDYVDVHLYKQQAMTETLRVEYQGSSLGVPIYLPSDFYDTATNNQKLGAKVGTKGEYGVANKPTMRGESGFFTNDANTPDASIFANDTQGIWLHKYIWGQINSSGLYDSSYWYPNTHIYNALYHGSTFDFRDRFKTYYDFIKDIPLSNGNYQEINATVSNPALRVMGQKDLVNGNAHFWIDNSTHTWGNVVYNPSAVLPITGGVSISELPQGNYEVNWIDPYTGNLLRTDHLSIGQSGTLTLNVTDLTTDTAVKVAKQ